MAANRLRTALALLTLLAHAAAAAADTPFARVDDDADALPRALQMAVVSYAPAGGHDDIQVDLIGAIHIADRAYYRELNERFRRYDVLLYELVTRDGDTQTRHSGGAGFVAGMQVGLKSALGLTFQLDEINYDAANFVHADLSTTELSERMDERGESLYVYFWRAFFSSMDQYASDPLNVRGLSTMSRVLASGRNDPMKIDLAYQLVDATGNFDLLGGPETGSAIVQSRNEHAIDVLRTQLAAGKKRIGVFYGVAHMPDFEQRLTTDLELRKTGTEWLDAWLFEGASP